MEIASGGHDVATSVRRRGEPPAAGAREGGGEVKIILDGSDNHFCFRIGTGREEREKRRVEGGRKAEEEMLEDVKIGI